MAVKLPLGFDPVMNYARDRVNGHVQEGLARLPVPGGRVVFDISKKFPPPPPFLCAGMDFFTTKAGTFLLRGRLTQMESAGRTTPMGLRCVQCLRKCCSLRLKVTKTGSQFGRRWDCLTKIHRGWQKYGRLVGRLQSKYGYTRTRTVQSVCAPGSGALRSTRAVCVGAQSREPVA